MNALRLPLAFVSLLAALACAPPSPKPDPDPTPANTFALIVADEAVSVAADERTLLQVLTIGAGEYDVTLTANALPSFATLSGSVLTFTPALADAGDYEIELVAVAGPNTASALLQLTVTRGNTPPMWGPTPMVVDGSSATPARARLWVCDPEGDNLRLDLETVLAPTNTGILTPSDFTGTPTLTIEVDWSTVQALGFASGIYVRGNEKCADLNFPLTGLAPGTYGWRALVTDVFGAEDPYGWVQFRNFTVAP